MHSGYYIVSLLLLCVTLTSLSGSYINDNCTKRDAAIVTRQWNEAFGHQTSDATIYVVGYMVFAPLVTAPQPHTAHRIIGIVMTPSIRSDSNRTSHTMHIPVPFLKFFCVQLPPTIISPPIFELLPTQKIRIFHNQLYHMIYIMNIS